MGNRKKNPATIPGKTRNRSVRAPVVRKYTKEEIVKNNERWRKMEFAKGNPDWETAIHPSHTYDENGPLKQERK